MGHYRVYPPFLPGSILPSSGGPFIILFFFLLGYELTDLSFPFGDHNNILLLRRDFLKKLLASEHQHFFISFKVKWILW